MRENQHEELELRNFPRDQRR